MIDLDAIQPKTLDFTLGGASYSIPTLDALQADAVLDLIDKGDVSRNDVIALFRGVIATHAPGALKDMTVERLKALLDAWQATGDVGESSPSSD